MRDAAGLARRSQELAAAGVPHVSATVVRAQRPASAHAGDGAIVLADGTIEGFVGGSCAEHSVRAHALETLRCGDALLLRVLPFDGAAGGGEHVAREEGAVTVQNPCLSGGALEIFLEPVLPAPRMLVAGEGPIAAAVRRLAAEVGLEAAEVAGGEPGPRPGDLAVLVATHGREELALLRAALEAQIPYVGLLASRARGGGVLAELRADGVPEELLARIDVPAGIDIGARTPGEAALSILARIVEVRRRGAFAAVAAAPASALAAAVTDPVCGMSVAPSPQTPSLEHDGRTYHFCCEGCREQFRRRIEHATA